MSAEPAGPPVACAACGSENRTDAKFCNECGAALADAPAPVGERKQVTVMFVDVSESMGIAESVDAEDLHAVMTALFNRCAAAVQRFGGTVDKFTGDGIMALFGAPMALEDHALRACMTALEIQSAVAELAAQLNDDRGIDLAVRIGLNSGEVVAGGVGMSGDEYTAVGRDVGRAQRLESIAEAGSTLLSEATARLVGDHAELVDLGEREMKGVNEAVRVFRLESVRDESEVAGRGFVQLVGRDRESADFSAALDQAVEGRGGVIGLVGAPGVGKSRLIRELRADCERRGVDVYLVRCESHTSDVPYYSFLNLMRTAFDIAGLDAAEARSGIVDRLTLSNAIPARDDLLLLFDFLGVGDPDEPGPKIDSDARRRRLLPLIKTAVQLRPNPCIHVVEDMHWVDKASDEFFGEIAPVLPATSTLLVGSFRPEYHGALTNHSFYRQIPLAPLDPGATSALAKSLLGEHPSVDGLAEAIAEKADGNPFFVEEIVRDLAETGALSGGRGAHRLEHELDELSVPATVHAALAARIDRLSPDAKRAISAAAIAGSESQGELIAHVLGETEDALAPAFAELMASELFDQVEFVPRAVYAFRHPLVRDVANESLLSSTRAALHTAVADAMIAGDDSDDERAPLIAGHYESAGDHRQAFNWHIRAGAWFANRDTNAARASWRRALAEADEFALAHPDDENAAAMRILPRSMLSVTQWRTGGGDESRKWFDELRELATNSGDQIGLVMGYAGATVTAALCDGDMLRGNQFARELVVLTAELDDPYIEVGMYAAATLPLFVTADFSRAIEIATKLETVADGDPTLGGIAVGSPLAWGLMVRGLSKLLSGDAEGGRADEARAIEMAREHDRSTFAYCVTNQLANVLAGFDVADESHLSIAAEAREAANEVGDEFTRLMAEWCVGCALMRTGSYVEGVGLLTEVRRAIAERNVSRHIEDIVDLELARDLARRGLIDEAIAMQREAIERATNTGRFFLLPAGLFRFARDLLSRGDEGDAEEAGRAIAEIEGLAEGESVSAKLFYMRALAMQAAAAGDHAAETKWLARTRKLAKESDARGHLADLDSPIPQAS